MKQVFRNIRKCERLYITLEMDDLAKQLLLKLALLETAGWLEDSFDKLYLSCAPNEKARSIMEKYITKIHSFNWENLHKGLSFGLGVKRVCELEDFAGEENICKMKSIIGNIKSHRDELAHNYVIQITKQFIPFKTLKKNILFINDGINFIKKHIEENKV